jgi:redox-sensitive bicupin YhaK (pirin superfamily)
MEMKKEYRKIKNVLPPSPPHMVGDGFRVHNFFPSYDVIGLNGMSPFFLLDYNSKVNIPPSENPKGVGVHPHRGFETVTIAYHGKVAHHDSAGNSGVINEGDVQWMTAGSGVLHKEYHEKEFSSKGGPFQMVQLWVNLPSKFKMTPARYQAIENKKMGKYKIAGEMGVVDVIAGAYNGVKGPAYTFTTINLFNAALKSGAKIELEFPENYNTGILVIEGEIKLNEEKIVQENCFALFAHEGESIIVEAIKSSKILVLSGKPIDEPVAAYGPFVMNTQREIQEAFDDFYSGKFGYLED